MEIINDEEVVPVVITANGDIAPTKNDKILLVDADTLVFATCSTTQQLIPILPKEFYTKEEWEDIINDPFYIEDAEELKTIDLDLALTKVEDRLASMLESTGCISWELHFTGGKDNFRYSITNEKVFLPPIRKYKGNRDIKDIPAGNKDLKLAIIAKYSDRAYMHTVIEADDAVVAKMKYAPNKYILSAVDKDVLPAVVGTHWNYFYSAKLGIVPKWVTITKGDTFKHSYLQTLMGDRGDNIQGLIGIGKVTVTKLLASCTTAKQCEEVCIAKYLEKRVYRGQQLESTEQDFWDTFTLVSMHQVEYKGDGKYDFY